ncbi:MAG: hypothetical protein P8I55_12345 [Crocinitomix sp.]|nr:hypothetical protein [Crocinitomix sp.]|tara:strand:+ start:196 stop:585 length:390 start_codon:yes stop_codon:yes gene_type:complete
MDPIVLTYIFAFAYLVIFSLGANRYNRDMDKISGLRKVLKHPDVKKEIVQKDFKTIMARIKKRQKLIYAVLAILTLICYALTLMRGLSGIYLAIPAIMLVGSILLLLFFYSFKGGRVIPDKVYISAEKM